MKDPKEILDSSRKALALLIKETRVLHPKEYFDWEKNYPWLKGNNIKVIDNNDHDIHYYFGKAFAQVGVYSTALIEGMGYNLQTFIATLPMSDRMQYLIDSEAATLVNNANEINEVIESSIHKKNPYNVDLFWKNNSLNNVAMAITNIMNKND